MSDLSAPNLPGGSPKQVGQVARQADQMFCFACGHIIHASAPACPSCGASQAGTSLAHATKSMQRSGLVNAMFCHGCGQPMHAAAITCPGCGAPQRTQLPAGPRKDRTTAIVLAFLLGGVGAHKFYLGQVGLGILYLLFCWTFIPSVVAMIEGVIFLTKSEDEFVIAYS